MNATPVQVAEAFSSHRFPLAFPHFTADIRWDNIGGETLAGREAVIAHCEQSARYLATVTTAFTEFRSEAGGELVIVESVASYTDASGAVSRVASCDLYRFEGSRLAAIRSYNIELPTGP